MQKVGLLIVIVLLGFLVAFKWLELTKTSEAPYRNIYDYKIVYVSDSTFKEDMKLMGNEGWEIVNTRRVRSSADESWGYEYIIKKTILVKDNLE